MRKSLQLILALVAAAAGLMAQKAPAFEVASIRQASMPTQNAMLNGQLRVGQQVDGQHVEFRLLSLKELIPIAYGVKPFQVNGPDWLGQQRFDIAATMPEGATKDQVPAMLQALLAERFHLKVHRDSKDQNVYALMQAKDGIKMKPAVEVAPPTREELAGGKPGAAPDGPGSAAKPADMTMTVNGQPMSVNRTANGATLNSADTGPMHFSMGQGGNIRMEFERLTMAKFAEQLTPMVDKPVLDRTELTGGWQVVLEMTMQDMIAVARSAGVAMPGMPPMAGGAGPGPAGGAPTAMDPGTGSVFTSVKQLGLRLESAKAPFDMVVVESVDRAPTDN